MSHNLAAGTPCQEKKMARLRMKAGQQPSLNYASELVMV
jgi:hypothetical protein